MKCWIYLTTAAMLTLMIGCDGASSGAGNPSGKSPAQPVALVTTMLPGGQQGSPYDAPVTAVGGTGSYAWNVVSGSLPPGLALVQGTPSASIAGTPTAPGQFSFDLEVVDTALTNAAGSFVIVVQPAQPLTITATSLPDSTVGSTYNQVIATSGGSLSGYSWAVAAGALPQGLSLGASGTNGVLQGSPTLAGVFNFTLQVTDSLAGVDTQSFSLTVHPALTLAAASLVDGAVSAPYSAVINASGGTGSGYTWSLLSGALPSGVMLSGSGLTATLQGTPTQSGSFVFVVRIQDSAGNSASSQYTLTILQIPSLGIVTATLPNATEGTPYSAAVTSTGGAAPYTWSIVQGALPAGLNLVPGGTTATIDGIPASAGVASFTIQVQGAFSMTAIAALTIQVDPNLVVIVNSPTLPEAAAGFEYAVHLTASGGTPPYSGWQVLSGAPPLGVDLWDAPEGAMLSGTAAAAGTYAFTIQVSDASAATTTKTFSLLVHAATGPLAVATQYLGEWTTTFNVHTPLKAVGGSGTGHAWTVATGSQLPPGIVLTSTPAPHLTGKPTQSGTFTFALQVVDSQAGIALRNYTVRVLDSGPMRPLFAATSGSFVIRERSVFLLGASGRISYPVEFDGIKNSAKRHFAWSTV
jgi:hypothetical protein